MLGVLMHKLQVRKQIMWEIAKHPTVGQKFLYTRNIEHTKRENKNINLKVSKRKSTYFVTLSKKLLTNWPIKARSSFLLNIKRERLFISC